MIPRLKDYDRIVGKKVTEKIRQNAEYLQNKHVVHINSTSVGGGVAEILNTLTFLMNDVGIDTGWRVMLGSHSFFKITKGIHNALQGGKWKMTKHRKEVYLEYCHRNSTINHINDHDIVIIHDPQPCGMVNDYEKKTRWLWRCHIDTSHPNKQTLNFLQPFIKRYDGIIISSEQFRFKYLRKPQIIINPSIDPLTDKNKRISHEKARKILTRKGVDTSKPIISQVSRFDPWKDPFGVIKMYDKIRQKEDCQLVLLGDIAADDPQGHEIYHKVKGMANDIPGITVITEKNDLLVNALQQESSFVFQNSIREGFALTVSETLWKKTPVLGNSVGGIPKQIIDGKTGFIMKNQKDGVKKALRLMRDDNLRRDLGNNGHEHVRKNFLITRHLNDYLNLFNLLYPRPNL